MASNFISTASTDVVGVYTQDYVQVFPRARPLKANIKEDSKLMEHPIEIGAQETDHKIILQVEIELPLILQSADYRDTYAQIKQLFLNTTVLIVQTKATVYQNQIIKSLPHEEDPGRYDALALTLQMKEVIFAMTSSQFLPRSAANQNTTRRGTVQASTASEPQRQSVLYGLIH